MLDKGAWPATLLGILLGDQDFKKVKRSDFHVEYGDQRDGLKGSTKIYEIMEKSPKFDVFWLFKIIFRYSINNL